MSASEQMPTNARSVDPSNGHVTSEDRKSFLTKEMDQANEAMSEGKEALRHFGDETRKEMKKPTTGAAIAGAVVVGAATLWGVAEAALGAAAAFVVYRILKGRRGETPHEG